MTSQFADDDFSKPSFDDDRATGRSAGLPTVVKLLLLVVFVLFAARFLMPLMGVGFDSGGEMQEWVGKDAPELVVTTLDGKTIRLSEQRGKRVVVDFWATWCGPCVAEVPSFIRLVNEVPGDELLVVGVSSEDPATLKAFTAAQGMNYPVGNPGELAPPFSDVTAIPTTFFIDRNGKIQKVFVGLHEFDDLKRNATAADL